MAHQLLHGRYLFYKEEVDLNEFIRRAITVSISMIEQHLVIIKIEDDGIGMNSETLDKLFQRYYRGTNTNDNGSGTGLGLVITKQLVKLHNGSIQVKSTPNKGTMVRILLPTSIAETVE